jgi:uncharacterized protein (TIGR02452 family)
MQIDRTRAAELGRDTLEILHAGTYQAPSGHMVDLREAITQARIRTITYPPDRKVRPAATDMHPTQVMVSNETTLAAATRLVAEGRWPVALNFASARHPGGGFLSGARAQEESLARSSALYACLEGNPMYAWHEARRNPFYSDYAIYSPDVPVFRTDRGVLLDDPYQCAFITCPAVNAKVALERDPACHPAIRRAMAQRIARVLAVAAAHGHEHLILGAWGCGAFGNDPGEIAPLFQAALTGPYRGVFATILFAILDWSAHHTIVGPFEQAFAEGWDQQPPAVNCE